ncbi:MAG: DNA mismatch repair endonuclease MutL [Candidatus Levybacteria bacterium]|nr:DNA mismatch repair endonuclease MutL [Candidatus Levybacteria bacterium]
MISKNKTAFAKDLRKNQTIVEGLLWQHLRARQINGIKFRRQQTIGKYIVDFVSLEYKLIIELDGGQHNTDSVAYKDSLRTQWLETEGFKVLRFWDNDVSTNLSGVLETIQSSLTPALSPNGRGSTKNMIKIQQLSQDVIAKIAAGEVIERPVYAVKELVENSIDAGADSLIINIENSGLARITVIDNGSGMSPEDVKACVKLHTTSKLDSIDSLSSIQTLGFRGEALASIAAISTLTVQSKRKEDTGGTSVVVKDGKVLKVGSVGMPVGTQVTVENLFHSVPARKKFLKSLRTEFRHIIETVMHFAFAHPHIHFVLTHNGKTIFDLPKVKTDSGQAGMTNIDRMQTLLGKDVHANLLPITFEDNYISLAGFIARPQMTTRTPHKQYLFVNKRSIGDKGISMAVKAAYGTLVEKNAYPICILFFAMPHEVVDVNVHPRKEEVRFVNQSQLHKIIKTAVTQTLARHDLVFHNALWQKEAYFDDDQFKSSTDSYMGKVLRDQKLPWKLVEPLQVDSEKLIQMHNLYLVLETKNGLVLIDQHAAHERIRYEQLLAEFLKQKQIADVFYFPKPKIIDFSVSEKELVEEYIAMLGELGFVLEHFKGTNFLLRCIPGLLQDRDYKEVLFEVLENVRVDGKLADADTVSQKIIAYLACHGSVKAGDILTKEQSSDLIAQLEKSPNNATCPHGRPTKVAIDLEMIHKMFKR